MFGFWCPYSADGSAAPLPPPAPVPVPSPLPVLAPAPTGSHDGSAVAARLRALLAPQPPPAPRRPDTAPGAPPRCPGRSPAGGSRRRRPPVPLHAARRCDPAALGASGGSPGEQGGCGQPLRCGSAALRSSPAALPGSAIRFPMSPTKKSCMSPAERARRQLPPGPAPLRARTGAPPRPPLWGWHRPGAERSGLTLLGRRQRRGTWKRSGRLSAAVGVGAGTGAGTGSAPPALTGVLLPQQLQQGGEGGSGAAAGSPGQHREQRLGAGAALRGSGGVSAGGGRPVPPRRPPRRLGPTWERSAGPGGGAAAKRARASGRARASRASTARLRILAGVGDLREGSAAAGVAPRPPGRRGPGQGFGRGKQRNERWGPGGSRRCQSSRANAPQPFPAGGAAARWGHEEKRGGGARGTRWGAAVQEMYCRGAGGGDGEHSCTAELGVLCQDSCPLCRVCAATRQLGWWKRVQDGAQTRRDHRHPLSLAHVHRHPQQHTHPPPRKVPAPGFQRPPKPSPPSFTPLSSQPSSCCSFQLPFTFPQPTLGKERRQRPLQETPWYLARLSGTCSALSCSAGSASLASGGCGAARGSGQRPQAVPTALGHAQPGGEAPQRCQPRGAK